MFKRSTLLFFLSACIGLGLGRSPVGKLNILSPESPFQILYNQGTEAARITHYQRTVFHAETGKPYPIRITVLIYSPERVRLAIPVDERITGRIRQNRHTGIAWAHFEGEPSARLGRPKIDEFLIPREKMIHSISPNAFFASGNENIGWETTAVHWNNGKMVYGKGAKFEGNTFPCFCIFRDGKVSVEDLQFQKKGEKWEAQKKNGEEMPFLETAISFKPVVRQNVPLAAEERLPAFVDLRHVFKFPYIGPDDLQNLGVKVENLMSGALFFGLDKLDLVPKLAEQSLLGPIQLPKNITVYTDKDEASELPLPDQLIVKIFEEARYKKCVGLDSVKEPGEYKIEEEKVIVFLKPASYPHHAIGVSRSGNVVEVFVEGKSGRLGLTLDELSAELLKWGVVDGGSVDQGGGIYFWLQGKEIIKPAFSKATSVIVGTLKEIIESAL